MSVKAIVPQFHRFIDPIFQALKLLGGSGNNDEIYEKTIDTMHLSNEVIDIPHLNSSSQSEVQYRMAWARTYLKKYGAIKNSARSIWSITPDYTTCKAIDSDA